MRATYIGCMAALLPALASFPAAAQERVCRDTETIAACEARLVGEAGSGVSAEKVAAAAAMSNQEENELQKKATGPNISESLAQSAIRDFLPRFAGSFLTSDPTEELRALDLRFNTPLAGPTSPRLQGGITLHKAELYDPLVAAIPESIREASRERLQDELEDGDDATAFLSVNFEGRTIGRAFARHRAVVDDLARQLVDSAIYRMSTPNELAVLEDDFYPGLRLLTVIVPDRRDDPACVDLSEDPVIPRAPLSQLPVSCLMDAQLDQLDRLFLPVTRYEAGRQIAIANAIGSYRFDRLADLVNNQPQFNLTAEYRSRLAAVGPNEWVGRARWEWGLANMNGLRSHCARMDRAHAQNSTLRRGTTVAGTVSLACLDEYAGSDETKARLARSDRFWLAAEGRYRPDYDVELEEDSVTFSLASGWGWGISGGYGRYLGSADADEKDRDRIDLHLSYDHAGGADPDGDEDDDDGLRQSRFLAGLFYTLRISGNASGIVGLSWANRSEFVGGADRQLDANLGLSYKFNGGTGN